MSELWVIGNGFDLWHQLPTKYSDFYQFAWATLDELEDYFALEIRPGGPWCDFENSLGNFLWSEFYDDHNYIDTSSDDFRPSFAHNLEDDLIEQADQIVDAIKDSFREWVEGINTSSASGRLALPTEALFITFNYTSTLEHVYSIPVDRILHIHGRAETYDDLIFGHGRKMGEVPELEENGDSNRTVFSDAKSAAKYPFHALQKPVQDVLKESEEFFRALGHITEITVAGHSLNRIDLPYFREVAASAPDAHWRVCYFGEDDRTRYVEELVGCGVPEDKIRICSYDDLQL